jgi:hypothetical protein
MLNMKFIDRFISELVYLIQDIALKFKRKSKPTLIAHNVVWFTNCSWVEQLVAFDQIYLYHSNK